MFCPRSGTKQAQPGSALALPVAFADINIHKAGLYAALMARSQKQ
jgi:hypothetical protein